MCIVLCGLCGSKVFTDTETCPKKRKTVLDKQVYLLLCLIHTINLCALDIMHIERLTRVERTKYESGDQQRSEIEWKFGMETHLRTHS